MDGINWQQIVSDNSFLGAIDRIGVGVGVRNNGGPSAGSIPWFSL